jgi:sugar lactone lactonase YvrE
MPRSAVPSRATALVAGLVAVLVGTAVPATAGPPDDGFIVLKKATSAEGIARGDGSTFDVARRFIDAPVGRAAVGMDTDRRHDLLFVAGGATGDAYVYDTNSGRTVATYDFNVDTPSFINDVVVTEDGAWFTDSVKPVLYFVPIGRHGELGAKQELPLLGGAAELTGDFNLNGIAATRSGRALVVAHSSNGALYTVDPRTGESAQIQGVSVPNVDGIEINDGELWAVQNMINQVSRIDLDRGLRSGEVEEVITDDDFQFPTTAIRYRGTLAVVNAKFDTGFPPTADQYEVVLVDD